MRFGAKTISTALLFAAIAFGLLIANLVPAPSGSGSSCPAGRRASACAYPGDQFRWDVEWSIVGLVVGMCAAMLITLFVAKRQLSRSR